MANYRNSFISALKHFVEGEGSAFAQNVYPLMTFNPTPSNNDQIRNLMEAIIGVIQPLYIIAILATSIHLFFVSSSPQGRSNARATLQKLILSMFIFTLSPLILEAFLEFSQSLTEAVFKITGAGAITEILEGGIKGSWAVISYLAIININMGANPWAITLWFMAWFPYIFLSARNIALVLLEILFPLSILLYSFNYTRGIGRTMLEQTITWTLLQFFWALTLVAVVLSVAPIRNTLVTNPDLAGLLGGFSIPGWIQFILSFVPGSGLFFMLTKLGMGVDIATLIMGIAGYAMIATLPLVLFGILRGFLP